MKFRFLLFFLFLSLAGYSGTGPSKEPVDYVDLFTGTSNSRWMLGPYASVPYGMVELGPDNQASGWMGGYEYSLMNVSGFSHIHAWTMSGLRVMPAMQDFTKDDGAPDRPYRGASSGYPL
jgi:putative alpha-1,2-mannosidase